MINSKSKLFRMLYNSFMKGMLIKIYLLISLGIPATIGYIHFYEDGNRISLLADILLFVFYLSILTIIKWKCLNYEDFYKFFRSQIGRIMPQYLYFNLGFWYLLYYKYVSNIYLYLLPLVIGVVATLMHKNMPIWDRCQENRAC